MSVVRFRPEAPFFNECHWHSLKNNTSVLRNRKLALGNMPVAYFNQRGFFRRKSDSARRCSVGAASNPSSSQKIALARKTKYAAVAHLVERHLAKVEVASSSLVTRSIEMEHLCSMWCHSQVVRQSSAKAPLPSSNLGGTSIKITTPNGVVIFIDT